MLEPTIPRGATGATELLDRARALLHEGAVHGALEALTGLDGAHLTHRARSRALATALECRLARGDLAEAMAHGDRLDTLLPDLLSAADGSAAVAHHARGELASALSEPVPAAQHYAAAGELVGDDPAHVAELPWRAGAALALLRAGQRRPAVEHAVTHLDVARTSGSPYAVATALRTLAATDAGPGRLALLRRARASLDGVRADRLAAQVDTDLAGLLLLDARPEAAEEARVLLRRAEAYAGREELWPLQGRVRRLLERLGESPRRAHREALAVLTPGELRVARLAADGLTNRQIAETLVVTVKAVEWHLSHVYRKLGISSRTRLAAALGVPT